MNLSAINHRIPLDTVYEDEASDSLSSEEFSQNLSPRSNKENNPYYQQQFNTDCDSESTMTSQTKKIRKKRTAYQKIDDDIRIQLWEAVQQNGESLKCAAKRLNINYSSAKSILHTYRKEGRILKKSALERPIKAYDFGSYEPEAVQFTLPPLSFSEFIPNKNHGYQQNVQNIEVYQESTATTSFGGNSPSSPMHGLADNLCQISLENQDPNRDQRFNDQMFMPKPQLPSLRPINKPKLPLGEIINESTPNANTGTPSPIIPAFRLPSNHQPGNPLDALKHLDNFYMNYSNSPLSGNNKMYQECSDSGSRSKFQKEFDSFSDMVNCLQSSNRPVDESKGDIQIPKPLKLNPMQIMQDKVDSQMIREESPVWTKNLENAAFDTYKSFMDANWLLQDAIKKANQLNTLVHLQKSGVSPTNQWQM